MGYKCPTCGKNDIRIFSKGSCVVCHCDACGGWNGLEGDQNGMNRLIEESKAEVKREEAYNLALSHAQRAKKENSPEAYMKAKKEFDNLGEFKDAQQQAKACWDAAHRISVRKQKRIGMIVLAAAVLIVVLASAYVVKVLRPSQIYQQAQTLYEAGDYSGALEKYNADGNYKDSKSRAILCTALLNLQSGDPESALQSLVSLQEDGEKKLAATLASALSDAVASWQEEGISAETLLWMLTQQETFDPDGELDAETLALEAHLLLADTENAVDWYVPESDEDAAEQLMILRTDGSVEAYQLTDTGNETLTLNRAQLADALLTFGLRLLEIDPETALACDLTALEERTDTEARTACVSAYQQCALKHEETEDYDSALADALAGFDISPSAETFTFYVELMQRRCAAEEDQETGIALWRTFVEETDASFAYYEMEDEAQAHTAQLCLNYALSLASWCDDASIVWFEEAKAEGADIEEGLTEALGYFTPCRTSVELRMMLLDELEEGSEAYEEQEALLSDELIQLLDGNGSAAALTDATDRLVLLLWAVELDALAEDTDVMSLYYAALEDAAGAATMLGYTYEDWNQNGWPDLIGLDAQGRLVDYSVTSEEVLCYTQEESGFSDMQILEDDQVRVLAMDAEGTAFAVYVMEDGVPVRQFAVDGVVSLTQSDHTLTYDVALECSIERYQRCTYEIGVSSDQAVEQEILWPEEDYPLPETPQAAVEQALEAYALGLDEEYALLVAEGTIDGWMSYEMLGTLPAPSFPLSLTADSYWSEDGFELVRAAYAAADGTVIRYFTLNQDEAGVWRLAGVSETALMEETESTGEPDENEENTEEEDTAESLSLLLCLNQESQDMLTEAGESRTYEVILPYDARVYMSWQSGSENGSKTAYQVVLCKEDAQNDPIFSYSLKASASTQQSQTMLLSAGTYQLTVTAGEQDFGEYTVALLAEAGIVIEEESNDEVGTANTIGTNAAIYATLSEETDADFYKFILENPASVTIQLDADAEQEFQVSLYAQLPNEENTYQTTMVNSLAGGGTTETTALAAGNYIVKVESDGEWTGDEYALTVLAEENENGEAEPNNTLATATPLQTGSEIQAAAGTNGDIDYFSFTLDTASKVGVSFAFPVTTSDKETYTISLVSDSDAVIWSASAIGTEGTVTSADLVLPAGTYAVKIENLKWSSSNDNSYSLLVSAETVDAETEPNDSLTSNATELALNTTVYGSILPLTEGQTQDIDNYTFTLETAGCVTVQLDYEEQDASSSVYQITLADADAVSIWSGTASGKEQVLTSGQIWLDAGVYLIQLREGKQNTPAAYQLSVACEADEYSEREINDTEAVPLTLGAPIHGSVATETDVDCFAFTLTEQTTLHLTCSAAEAESGSLLLSILQDGEELWNKEFLLAEGEMSQSLQIPAGSYVLEVSAGEDWSNAAYELSLGN